MGVRTRYCLMLCVALAGCLHTPTYQRPFTEDWADRIEHDREFKARKQRVEDGNLPLVGKKGGTRAQVEENEEGERQLNVGGATGLSADVDFHGGEPDVKVKYRIKW